MTVEINLRHDVSCRSSSTSLHSRSQTQAQIHCICKFYPLNRPTLRTTKKATYIVEFGEKYDRQKTTECTVFKLQM